MGIPAAPTRSDPSDGRVAVATVCLLSVGSVVGVGGAVGGDLPLALGGAALAAAALTLLFAAGWLPGLGALALSLPLPALYSGPGVRLSPAAALTGLVLFGWALGRVSRAGPIQLAGLPRRSTAALFAAIVVASLFADARVAALRELVNFGLLLGLLVVATDILTTHRGLGNRLARTLAGIAGVAGVLAALQVTGAIPAAFPLVGTSLYRATLGFGWPNELGMYFAVSLPLCWYALRVSEGATGRALAAVAFGAAGLGLLATFSRGSWLAFLLSVSVLLFSGEARLALRVALGVALSVGLVDLAGGGVVSERLLSLADDPYVIQRGALMFVGVLMFLSSPIVGVGPGGFGAHLEDFGPQVPFLWDYVGSAHNAYLEIAAETGALGLAALLLFLGAVFFGLLRSARASSAGPDALLRRGLLWSFTAACIAGFTAWPFAHGIGQLIVLVIAMGLAAARAEPLPERRRDV